MKEEIDKSARGGGVADQSVKSRSTLRLRRQKKHDGLERRAARSKGAPGSEERRQLTIPSAGEMDRKWKEEVAAARIAWDQLTEGDLLKLEAHKQSLASLLQKRYSLTRDEAASQVKNFQEKHRLFA